MQNIKTIFEQLIARDNLSANQMNSVIKSFINQGVTETQIAVFLALMRMKGETIDELTQAAKTLLQFARTIDLGSDLLDIVGTGGDGQNTFNISTVSSIVAASAGVRIAKHGSTSVSSRSGSADLLKKAGITLELNDSQLKQCIDQTGLCFLFAQQFHPAWQNVRAARQQLGVRSFFNILGPLVNPARVTKQIVGVFSQELLMPVATILSNLGSERAFVVHSRDGLDEFSIAAETDVVELDQGKYSTWSLNPKDYNCYHETLDAIQVNSAEESLTLMNDVLSGKKGAARDIVLLNSAAAIILAGKSDSFDAGVSAAAKAIDSGAAHERFELIKKITGIK